MGQWTWLFTQFPLADIELMSEPIDAKVANVLVRTFRVREEAAERLIDVRVAPHNTANFRGGPWFHTFTEQELTEPGEAVRNFREALAKEIEQCRSNSN